MKSKVKPFDELKIPSNNDIDGIDKYVKAFEDEYGDDYELNPWVDPSYDYDVSYESELQMKFERIKRRNELKKKYKDAVDNGDDEELQALNELRYISDEYEDDDGWNYKAYLNETKI